MPPLSPSRRQVLSGISALAAGVALGAPLLPRAAQAAGTDDFLAVSRSLVGNHALKPEFAAALQAAFAKTDPGFGDKLKTLRGLIGDGPVTGEALKARLSDAPPEVAALPQALLTGWYLGIAGSGEQAVCVAYVDALSNVEVADVLRPPSYAYGAYGSWANPPV
ncbi:hypothetical protein GR170_08710 [Pseudooceanicola sp. GBMRC 2024]|uniref:Sorbitol dehydrogenase n=1 Tax=Pseudooceanicola albus TaxID=2692189 RepID=A0A6L7G0Q6_9RHOB|nr:sugar dehydrogenase complex small subunit [Pseudooceanicola albus]MXN17914.1 hypothetical protein [Pseudooceanicola albus]